MLKTSKTKWFACISLASIFLVLALIGGNWGTDYSARASVDLSPHISYIDPSGVLAGAPETVLIIAGSGFGTVNDTAVRISGPGYDQMISPMYIIPTGMSIKIPSYLLALPNTLSLTVYVSTAPKPTIPTIPTWPGYDNPSNTVEFIVYPVVSSFLPIITR